MEAALFVEIMYFSCGNISGNQCGTEICLADSMVDTAVYKGLKKKVYDWIF